MAVKIDKQMFKKWWFWAIIIVMLGLISSVTDNSNTIETVQNQNGDTAQDDNSSSQRAIIYKIKGEVLGEYGKEVILNKDTDMPAKKYVYKIPAGSYRVTTTYGKMASFFIIKDPVITNSGDEEYPEELNYASEEPYFLTSGEDDFNGRAKKEMTITLSNDENIQVVGTEKLTFEKQ